MATILVADKARSPSDRITRAYEAAFARPPSAQELQDALEFLDTQRQRYKKGTDDLAAWADLCHVLMNVKEFIFIR